MKLEHCTVCGKKRLIENDHVIPRTCGGVETWPLCVSCHDIIDRIDLDKWDREEAFRCLQEFWSKCGPDGRMWMLKMFKIMCHGAKRLGLDIVACPPR